VGTSYGADIFPTVRLCLLLYEIVIGIITIFIIIIIIIIIISFFYRGFIFEILKVKGIIGGGAEVVTGSDVTSVCVPRRVF